MDNPSVSVIVATYRRDKSLTAALNSLAEQTFDSFEVIVVDDNASEEWNLKVAQIIQKVNHSSGMDIRHIICEQNGGSAKARNIGINSAKGEFITFLDDDDLYLPEKIRSQFDVMKKTGADFGITDLLLYNENGTVVDRRIRKYIKSYNRDDLLLYHLMHHMTGTDTLMFRSKFIREIGGFSGTDIGDEFYLIAEAINNGGRFCYQPECHVKAFVHTGHDGLSSGTAKIDGENALYEYKKRYFEGLSKKQIRYIKSRHYAVLAYTYMRGGKFGRFVCNAIKSFAVSPRDCIGILLSR